MVTAITGTASGAATTMVKIFLDIENTIIDSLFDMNFMEENCKKLRYFCLGRKDLLTVNFFTWGWKDKSEIDQAVVNKLFEKLGIDEQHQGIVLTKEDSVDLMIKQGFLNEEDREAALQPGAMMNEFGLTKMECFIRMADKFIPGTMAILIDDLVEQQEIITNNDCVTTILLNPKELTDGTKTQTNLCGST